MLQLIYEFVSVPVLYKLVFPAIFPDFFFVALLRLAHEKPSLIKHARFCCTSVDPKAETRLYIMVNDFEFHVYNRSDLYGQLQELFGLDPTIIPPKKDDEKARENGRERSHSNLERYS